MIMLRVLILVYIQINLGAANYEQINMPTASQYRFRYFIRSNNDNPLETEQSIVEDRIKTASKGFPALSKINNDDYIFTARSTITTSTTTNNVDIIANSTVTNVSSNESTPIDLSQSVAMQKTDQTFGNYRTGIIAPPKKLISSINSKPVPFDDVYYRRQNITIVKYRTDNPDTDDRDNDQTKDDDKIISITSSPKSVQVELNYKDESAPEKLNLISSQQLSRDSNIGENRYAPNVSSDIKQTDNNVETNNTSSSIINAAAINKNRLKNVLNRNFSSYNVNNNNKTPSLNTVTTSATFTPATITDVTKSWWGWWNSFDQAATRADSSHHGLVHSNRPMLSAEMTTASIQSPAVTSGIITPQIFNGPPMIFPLVTRQKNSIANATYNRPIFTPITSPSYQQSLQNHYFHQPITELFKVNQNAMEQLYVPIFIPPLPPPPQPSIASYGLAPKVGLPSPSSSKQCEKQNNYHWNPATVPSGVLTFLLIPTAPNLNK